MVPVILFIDVMSSLKSRGVRSVSQHQISPYLFSKKKKKKKRKKNQEKLAKDIGLFLVLLL